MEGLNGFVRGRVRLHQRRGPYCGPCCDPCLRIRTWAYSKEFYIPVLAIFLFYVFFITRAFLFSFSPFSTALLVVVEFSMMLYLPALLYFRSRFFVFFPTLQFFCGLFVFHFRGFCVFDFRVLIFPTFCSVVLHFLFPILAFSISFPNFSPFLFISSSYFPFLCFLFIFRSRIICFRRLARVLHVRICA